MDPLPTRPNLTASEVPTPVAPPQTPVVVPPPPVATPEPLTPVASATPPPAPPKSHKKLFTIAILLILILFISGVGAFYIASRQQNVFEPEVTATPLPTPEEMFTPEPTLEPTPEATPTPVGMTPAPSAGPSASQTKTITSQPSLDGFLASNGTANTTIDIRAGRNAYAITRGFVSFDLSSIPKNSTIESATLRLYQINTDGSPYTTGGNLMLDHVDYGNSLEGEDYTLAPLATGIATLTTNTNKEWKEAVITEAVRTDITNLRARTGIRVRFATEKVGGQSGGDYAYFEAAENYSGTGNIPQLIVKYK